jgi:hypothetical protein
MPKLTAKSYKPFLKEIAVLLEASRQQAARAVNVVLTATYWEIGRRIVEFEQKARRVLLMGRNFSISYPLSQRTFWTGIFPPESTAYETILSHLSSYIKKPDTVWQIHGVR